MSNQKKLTPEQAKIVADFKELCIQELGCVERQEPDAFGVADDAELQQKLRSHLEEEVKNLLENSENIDKVEYGPVAGLVRFFSKTSEEGFLTTALYSMVDTHAKGVAGACRATHKDLFKNLLDLLGER